MKKDTIVKVVGGVVTGLLGFCSIVTIDESLKQAKVKSNVIKGVGRYTIAYTLAFATIRLAHKLFDEMYTLRKEEEQLNKEVNDELRRMEEYDDEFDDEEID